MRLFLTVSMEISRYRRPCGLRSRSAMAWLLGSQVRIRMRVPLLCLLCVVWVADSATSWSLAQSHTGRVSVLSGNLKISGLGASWAVVLQNKRHWNCLLGKGLDVSEQPVLFIIGQQFTSTELQGSTHHNTANNVTLIIVWSTSSTVILQKLLVSTLILLPNQEFAGSNLSQQTDYMTDFMVNQSLRTNCRTDQACPGHGT